MDPLHEPSRRIKGRRGWLLPVLAGVVVLGLVIGFYVTHQRLESSKEEASSMQPGPAFYPPGTERATVSLYFASADGLFLVPEARAVLKPASLDDQLTETLRELVRGPSAAGIAKVLPPETTVRQVFLSDNGTAYVNFGPEIVASHPGGAGAEMLSVYAVVNTLADNFTEVRSVSILVEGQERRTLAGHIDITRPLIPRADLVQEKG